MRNTKWYLVVNLVNDGPEGMHFMAPSRQLLVKLLLETDHWYLLPVWMGR